jgi:hypothetical protein
MNPEAGMTGGIVAITIGSHNILIITMKKS